MNIRPYREPDAGRVVRLSLRAWAPVFESIERALDPAVYCTFYSDWRFAQQRAVEAALPDPDQNVWIAERDGEPVGSVAVALHREGRRGEIHDFARP